MPPTRQIHEEFHSATMTGVFAEIARTAQARGDAAAFDCGAAGRFTFTQMLAQAARFAARLEEFGVVPGDRVTVQVDKMIESVWLYLAVLRAGAVYMPLNTGYTDAEMDYFIDDAQPALVVVNSARFDAVQALASVRRSSTRVATLQAFLADGPVSDIPPRPRGTDDIAAIVYTSGTTGRSKGAMLSHGNLITNARTLISVWEFSDTDVLVHALPIYHVHGLFVALHCALFAGAHIRFLPRFDLELILPALRGATVFMGVPTYYTRLLSTPRFPEPGTALRLWISGSAPLLPETFAGFQARIGAAILERYGMTEAGMITSNPLRGTRLPGTVGRPLPGVAARVRAADGTLARAGDPGVLEIAGASVFSGYWHNPEKSRAAFTDDGFFVTGDVVTMGADGVVSIVGRQNDLIISGGLNVYPKEIEAEIDALPGVAESAVIGVPHPDFGEGVVAVVDAQEPGVDEASVISALTTRLAKFKVPKRVLFVAELPRNAMGKVQKKQLRERYGSLFEAPR